MVFLATGEVSGRGQVAVAGWLLALRGVVAPDRRLEGVGVGAVEGLNPQVLHHPFEEQLRLPVGLDVPARLDHPSWRHCERSHAQHPTGCRLHLWSVAPGELLASSQEHPPEMMAASS